MKKILSFIYAVLILTLNFVPCADAHEEIAVSNSSMQTNTDKNHEQHNTDACSPFCHCTCCSHLVITQSPSLQFIPFSEYQNVYNRHSIGKFIDVSLPVWQPPQLA